MSTYEISKSSLLSLKAEILRKQNELGKAKIQNNIKIAQHVKKNTPLDIKNKGIEKRLINDFVEDEDLLKKSRDALEAKSRLYDKLSKGKLLDDDAEELNKRYLVQFNKKEKHQDVNEKEYYSESEDDDDQINEDNYEPAQNSDDEWIEYTDCLGRTRKCLRKDLDHIKSNDAELRQRMEVKETVKMDNTDCQIKNQIDEKEVKDTTYNENSELLSSDMRRELLRKQWEMEEEELRNKTNVHYQDILFNEARTHGVGYYQFSKAEEVRKRQQEALKNLRKETEEQQRRAQELKQLREKQLKARVRAAKNRKRARMGLPPEEESDNEEPVPVPKPVIIPENTEDKEREETRKNHVRPWDIGKKGVKEHYVHTQEEWVEKKRKERPNEFAPPCEYKKYKEEKKSLYFTTKRKQSSDESDDEEPRSINPYKSSRSNDASCSSNFKTTPIVNELDVDSDDDVLADNSKSRENSNRKRTEIAPPASYETYSTKLPTKRASGNISESIDAGLKFLRMQSEKPKKSRRDDIFLD